MLASEEVRILVAEDDDDGEPVGYSAFGANRDPDAEPGVGEIRTFFVSPAHWRRGVGSELLRAALDGLREMGYEAASLWSFAANHPANAFYERAGFERDESERIEEVWADAPQVRYRRSL